MADTTAQDTDTTVDVDTSSTEAEMDDGTSFETEPDNQEDNTQEESDDTSDFDEGADDVTEKPKEKEEESADESEETEEESADEETEEEDTTSKDKVTKKGEPDPDKAREAAKERELRRTIEKEEREKQERITLDRYLAEAKEDEDELARRQLQVEAYNINKERAVLNEEKLSAGITRAKASIELLRDTDPIVQEELGNALDEFQAMYVVQNEQGDIVEVKADVYQYLQKKADSIQKLRGIGARQESQNKAKQKSRAMTPPSAKPKEGKKDEGLDAFDEEAQRW